MLFPLLGNTQITDIAQKESQPIGLRPLRAGLVSSFWHTDFFYLHRQAGQQL